ncbi:hypothetical protein Y032_0043g760 [Ancylostoma ceylanicum]|nr:hypothetical protein Y032_0043g760 [Ancylostoma ceylanicum]
MSEVVEHSTTSYCRRVPIRGPPILDRNINFFGSVRLIPDRAQVSAWKHSHCIPIRPQALSEKVYVNYCESQRRPHSVPGSNSVRGVVLDSAELGRMTSTSTSAAGRGLISGSCRR